MNYIRAFFIAGALFVNLPSLTQACDNPQTDDEESSLLMRVSPEIREIIFNELNYEALSAVKTTATANLTHLKDDQFWRHHLREHFKLEKDAINQLLAQEFEGHEPENKFEALFLRLELLKRLGSFIDWSKVKQCSKTDHYADLEEAFNSNVPRKFAKKLSLCKLITEPGASERTIQSEDYGLGPRELEIIWNKIQEEHLEKAYDFEDSLILFAFERQIPIIQIAETVLAPVSLTETEVYELRFHYMVAKALTQFHHQYQSLVTKQKKKIVKDKLCQSTPVLSTTDNGTNPPVLLKPKSDSLSAQKRFHGK